MIMKVRRLVCLILLLLVVGLVVAQTSDDNAAIVPEGDGEEVDTIVKPEDKVQSDYEKYQENIDKVGGVYNPDTGEFNDSSVFWGISEAEKNINGINEWLDSNVAWLKFVFRMVPEISWLFFFNILFVLIGFVHLGLNAAKYGLVEEEWLARTGGFGLFVILLVTNVYVFLAEAVVNILDVVFNQILTWTNIAIALVVMAVVIVILVALAIWAGPVLLSIWRVIAPLVGKRATETGAERVTAEAEKKVKKLDEKIDVVDGFIDGAGI